jgi:hypothetical protein
MLQDLADDQWMAEQAAVRVIGVTAAGAAVVQVAGRPRARRGRPPKVARGTISSQVHAFT